VPGRMFSRATEIFACQPPWSMMRVNWVRCAALRPWRGHQDIRIHQDIRTKDGLLHLSPSWPSSAGPFCPSPRNRRSLSPNHFRRHQYEQ
jgi:hypothetical protein